VTSVCECGGRTEELVMVVSSSTFTVQEGEAAEKQKLHTHTDSIQEARVHNRQREATWYNSPKRTCVQQTEEKKRRKRNGDVV